MFFYHSRGEDLENERKTTMKITYLLAMMISFAGPVAMAEDLGACKADAEKLCADVDEGAELQCLKGKSDKVSADCKDSWAAADKKAEEKKAQSKVQKEACATDFQILCGTQKNKKAIAKCMEKNKDKLSDECKTAREKMKELKE